MDKTDYKQIAYADFKLTYSDRIEKLRSALLYQNTYSAELKLLKLANLVQIDELDSHLKEWISLVSNFEETEKEYFKPYWVPIRTDNYSYFIDLSDDNLPLFETTYFIYEPTSYFNTVLFASVKDLMIALEENADLTVIAEQHFTNMMNNFRLKLVERNKLIFEGTIPIDPANFFEVTDEEELKPYSEEFDGEIYTITCNDVNAGICGLLPFTLPVKLLSSDFDHVDLRFLNGFDLTIIRTIKDFVHTCRMYCPHNLYFYECYMSDDVNESILFRDNTFTLKTSNDKIKKAFEEAYKVLMLETGIL